MRIIQFLFLALLLSTPHRASAADSGHTRVRALLVIASGKKGESDARLSAYEPTLRRMLRFDSYRLAGEGSVNLTSAGENTVNLGRGHSLAFENQKTDKGGIRLQISWEESGRMLMNTGVSPQPGVPMVLGGPSTGTAGEVWAVIVIAD